MFYVISCISEMECKFSNTAAFGGSQKQASTEDLTETECFALCLEMKKKNDTINGCAMYQNGKAGCFVQYGIQSLQADNEYKTCILTPVAKKSKW